MDVRIRKQRRKSLAFKLTPAGPVALIPEHLDASDPVVQAFIRDALAGLPVPEHSAPPMTVEAVHGLVAQWVERLGVEVSRTQIRRMTTKWGSISTAGTLTLAEDLLHLPPDLVEYVILHELMHLKFPNHAKGWQVSMGAYMSDWREREGRLQHTIAAGF